MSGTAIFAKGSSVLNRKVLWRPPDPHQEISQLLIPLLRNLLGGNRSGLVQDVDVKGRGELGQDAGVFGQVV
jgi:hypothetical protein